MADKMLRVAGRGADGLAKALKTDNSGNLGVENIRQLKEEIAAGGKNLFDISKTINGFLIGLQGQNVAGSGWATSDYMLVRPNKKMVTSGGRRIAQYDANKNYIAATYAEPTGGTYTFTTHANARYVRISNYTGATWTNTQVEYGETPTPLEPYKEMLYLDGRKYSDIVPMITELPNISSEFKAVDVETSEPISLSATKKPDGSSVLLVAESALPDAAHAFPVASGTGNTQAVTAIETARLVGFTVTASTEAQIKIYHGTSSAGVELFDINLTAGQSVREWFDMGGIMTPAGIFIERVSGTSKLTVFARATN